MGRRDAYEASNVHLGEYTSENHDLRVVCTVDELRHIDEGRPVPATETIAATEISAVRRDTDKSQAGFRRIGWAFGAFALVSSLLAAPFVLAGVFVSPVAGGSCLAAGLCWYGTVLFYRMDRGMLDVLEIEAGGEWYYFFTKAETDTFDEVLARLAHDVEQPSP